MSEKTTARPANSGRGYGKAARLFPEAQNIVKVYGALIKTGRVSELRRLQYRCKIDRCLLLDAVDIPGVGIVIHQPRFKYSADESSQYDVPALSANTETPTGHWVAETSPIKWTVLWRVLRNSGGMPLSCDHVLNYQLTQAEFNGDFDAGRTEVRCRADHSRYVLG